MWFEGFLNIEHSNIFSYLRIFLLHSNSVRFSKAILSLLLSGVRPDLTIINKLFSRATRLLYHLWHPIHLLDICLKYLENMPMRRNKGIHFLHRKKTCYRTYSRYLTKGKKYALRTCRMALLSKARLSTKHCVTMMHKQWFLNMFWIYNRSICIHCYSQYTTSRTDVHVTFYKVIWIFLYRRSCTYPYHRHRFQPLLSLFLAFSPLYHFSCLFPLL